MHQTPNDLLAGRADPPERGGMSYMQEAKRICAEAGEEVISTDRTAAGQCV